MAVSLHLIKHLEEEHSVSPLHVPFDLWLHAWSLLLEAAIAGVSGEIHAIGDTLGDGAGKDVLSHHDEYVDGLCADKEEKPSEQRAR